VGDDARAVGLSPRAPGTDVKISVFVGVSLDGFLARRDGAFDFLPEGGGEEHGYAEFLATVDALVIGRKTYEVVLGLPAWPYGERHVVVLGTSAITPPRAAVAAHVERLDGAPRAIAALLAARGVQHVYVDGGLTIQGFLRAGLVDRLVITRVPVLIGEGIPLFGPTGRDIALLHVATRALASGLVQSTYNVVRDIA
jgi:dihydrofolate reductase